MEKTGECMERIESADNPKIKWAASLHQRKERERRGEFIAEGIRLAETAIESSWPLLLCLVSEHAINNSRIEKIIASLQKKNCPVYLTSSNVYKKASATETPQGILLIIKKESLSLSAMPFNNVHFLTILDRIQDPGNAGTILRTADAAGCTGVIAISGTVDLFSDKTVRSAMGSVFHIPIVTQVTYSELFSYLKENSISCFASMLDKKAAPYYAMDYRQPIALAFGNEGNGVSDEIGNFMKHIFIPMAGQTESLNVAAASAIILYEAFRQRYAVGSFQQR